MVTALASPPALAPRVVRSAGGDQTGHFITAGDVVLCDLNGSSEELGGLEEGFVCGIEEDQLTRYFFDFDLPRKVRTDDPAADLSKGHVGPVGSRLREQLLSEVCAAPPLGPHPTLAEGRGLAPRSRRVWTASGADRDRAGSAAESTQERNTMRSHRPMLTRPLPGPAAALCLALAGCGSPDATTDDRDPPSPADPGDDEGCPEGLSPCDGGCFDLDHDPAHCGARGAACVPGQPCHEGACLPAGCPAGSWSAGWPAPTLAPSLLEARRRGTLADAIDTHGRKGGTRWGGTMGSGVSGRPSGLRLAAATSGSRRSAMCS